eukprot:1160696-Pelagomonas_calceolata.AAC.1
MQQSHATATFMFLPSWGGPMSTNPYSKLLNAYPHFCRTLGTIPSTSLKYDIPPFWLSQEIDLPCPSWSLQIIAVWNTAARVRLNENNSNWLTRLKQDIREARWLERTISNDPILNPRHPEIETGFNKFKKLPSAHQQTSHSTMQSQQTFSPLTSSSPYLVRKVANWREWAYTDGSCHVHNGNQVIGAGVYHPASDSTNHVQPNGAGITHTITRAELAAIAAAILLENKYPVLYPELHHQHVQGHILKIIIQLIRNSPTPIHFFKVKSHAGIVGNECADAIAKHQAIQDNDADITFPCANLEGNPFHDTTWLAFEETPCTHANASRRLNPPAIKLKHFSDLHDALRKHMHSKHRLGKANTNTGYYSYYQSLLPSIHKNISNSFWTVSTLSFKMRQNIFKYRTGTLFNQKHAVCFKISTSLQCPLCEELDSALHILSGCKNSTMSGMVTERHNIASRILLKAISKGPLGAGIASMDTGNADRLALQDLQIPEHATNRTLPKYIFPRRFPDKDRLTSSRPDALLVVL